MKKISRRLQFGFLGLLLLAACKSRLPFERVERIEELPYPTCENSPTKQVALQYLKSGPTMRDQNIREKFQIEDRGCVKAITVQQRWPLNNSDVEVLFDDKGKPLRVWKRMFYAKHNKDSTLHRVTTDTRLFELRGERVALKIRNPKGELEHRLLKGEKPIAVVGPGRGLLSIWIRAAKLEVGQIVRGPVLDFRDKYESIKQVALKREPDRFEPSLGGKVQVYTVFGRETVFTNEEGIVIGDLSGLRTDESPNPKTYSQNSLPPMNPKQAP